MLKLDKVDDKPISDGMDPLILFCPNSSNINLESMSKPGGSVPVRRFCEPESWTSDPVVASSVGKLPVILFRLKRNSASEGSKASSVGKAPVNLLNCRFKCLSRLGPFGISRTFRRSTSAELVDASSLGDRKSVV